ncbi:MAG: bifunctional riboflavin kinase/FAD synthetase [Corynebacterium sp.]|nr:bifunctional riboflavin kinase/FAD synthetase [Corynebacterium sp.]
MANQKEEFTAAGDKLRNVITIGVFDGVHRGHQQLISEAVACARSRGARAILLTFKPHPKALFDPEHMPPMLSTFEERADFARKLGIDEVVALPFDKRMAAMQPEEFIRKVLLETYNAQAVFVGSNFRFGFKAQGTTEVLKAAGEQHGFTVGVVDLLSEDGGTISSTRIRDLLENANIAEADKLLGRPYSVTGVVARGAGRGGKELGFPTANFYFPDTVALPRDGVYCGWFRVDTFPNGAERRGDVVRGVRYPTAISVGTNPTFGDDARSVEAHVLGRDADLYDSNATVEFVDFLREMEKFNSVDDLLTAIRSDVDNALKKLKVD